MKRKESVSFLCLICLISSSRGYAPSFAEEGECANVSLIKDFEPIKVII